MYLYQHSGKYGFAPALFLTVGVPALLILSAIYSYITLYNPITGYLTFLVIFGYVFISALLITFILKFGKCRNRIFVFAAGIIGGLLSLYFAWAVFLYALGQRYGTMKTDFLSLIINPFAVWKMVLAINKIGWFKIGNDLPKGIILWILWGIEAASIIIGIPWIVSSAIKENMFCEKCDKWCEVSETKMLKIPKEMSSPKASDFNPQTLGTFENAESITIRPVIQADLLKCGDCKTYAGWRYTFVDSKVDNKGNEKDKAKMISGIVMTQLG